MVTAMHLLALALLLVEPAPGDTLSGRVTDPDGAPVPAATVLISELHRVATSGADGAFRLADIPPGEYTVIVRHIGFAPFAREVQVHGPTTLTVTLRRAPVWLEPVTITATRAPSAALGSPLSAAALSEDGLRRDQSVSLAHSLARLPGVNALSTGAQIGKPVIRGLAGARVLVLANGNRLEDYSWSDEDGPSVDARLAQRVELIRGPASVLYGSDAVGGVVNVIPAELPDANGGPRMIRTGFELSGATNNAELEAAARVEGASGPWAWRVFGIGRAAGSLHTPAGELDNTGFGAVNGEAVIGRRGARSSTTLRYTRYAGEFKLLEADEPPSGEAGGPERKLSDDRVQATGDYLVGPLRLETKAQWQRHSLIEVSDTGTSPSGTPLEGTAFDLLLNTTSLDVLAHHGAGSAVRGTVGVSGLYQSNATRGPIPLVPGARVKSAAAFAFEQATQGRWSALAGGRVDVRRLTTDGNATLALTPERRDWCTVPSRCSLSPPTSAGRGGRPPCSSCSRMGRIWGRRAMRSATPGSSRRPGRRWTGRCAGRAPGSAWNSPGIATRSLASSISRRRTRSFTPRPRTPCACIATSRRTPGWSGEKRGSRSTWQARSRCAPAPTPCAARPGRPTSRCR